MGEPRHLEQRILGFAGGALEAMKVTSVCRKPSQAIMRARSVLLRHLRSASSTLRQIRRKSRRSAGMPTEDMLASIR